MNMLLEAEIRYQKLPDGVHVLSKESQEALKRAAEKGAAITAKHQKRGS